MTSWQAHLRDMLRQSLADRGGQRQADGQWLVLRLFCALDEEASRHERIGQRT